MDDRGTVGAVAQVQIDASQRRPLRRIWRYFGYDEPNYTYTARGAELLAKIGALPDGPYFVRCHFLFCSGEGVGRPKWGSSNVYTEDAGGEPVYSWEILDRILDAQLAAGCIPFVELGFTPEALSTAPAGTVYDDPFEGGWRFPPGDYERWRELVAAVADHCRRRYGLRQVQNWYWELWNEPDIFYWQGSVEEYCRLYDYTVAGLHRMIPQARVGGPATTSPARPEAGRFLEQFLDHCIGGKNAASGGSGTRIDFVSFHTKGGGYRTDPQAPKKTPEIYELLRYVEAGLDIVGRFPPLVGLEVVLSECDPDGWAAGSRHDNPNLQYRNTEYYASFVASSVCKLLDLGADGPNRVDGLLTWAFQFEDRAYFEGLRTLSTNGIDKPVLNVFRLLASLGSIRVELASDQCRDPLVAGRADEADDLPDISGVAAIDGLGRLSIFLVSHHDDWDVRTAMEVELSVAGLEAGRSYTVRSLAIGERAANAHTAWKELGAPPRPSAEQLEAIREAGRLEPRDESLEIDGEGVGRMRLRLDAHAVCLVELTPGRRSASA